MFRYSLLDDTLLRYGGVYRPPHGSGALRVRICVAQVLTHGVVGSDAPLRLSGPRAVCVCPEGFPRFAL